MADQPAASLPGQAGQNISRSVQRRKVRVVCISDTHNQTPSIPAGDLLIHAGDLTNQGSFAELSRQTKWLQSLPGFQAKIVVAGNHDITLDPTFFSQHGRDFHNNVEQDVDRCTRLMRDTEGITYLCHEPASITLSLVDGTPVHLKVFGSPYSPARGTWAFGYSNHVEADALWSQVAVNTDILITHTPPKSHCDRPGSDITRTGCEILRQTLWRTRPMLHVCGHMHEGRGAERITWSPTVNEEMYTEKWEDPGSDGNKKQSIVDLTGKKRPALQRGAETCVVNAAVKSWTHNDHGPKKFNKPIVVDLLLEMATH